MELTEKKTITFKEFNCCIIFALFVMILLSTIDYYGSGGWKSPVRYATTSMMLVFIFSTFAYSRFFFIKRSIRNYDRVLVLLSPFYMFAGSDAFYKFMESAMQYVKSLWNI